MALELISVVLSLRWDFRMMLLFPVHISTSYLYFTSEHFVFPERKIKCTLLSFFFLNKIFADNACSDHKNKLQRELPSCDPDRGRACFKPK